MYNFERHEIACKCGCGFDAFDWELREKLQDIRDHFESELGFECYILITSGNRCVTHNTRVMGAVNSMHTKAKAVDFKLYRYTTKKQIDSDYVYKELCKLFPNSHGIGKYLKRTHFDIRFAKARWDHSSK